MDKERARGGAGRAASVTHYRWEDMPREPVNDWMERRLITGERTMIAQVFLTRGSVVPEHAHENEQFTCVQQGAMKFLIEGEEIIVRAGEVLHIPSHVPHQATMLEDTVELDIFTPPRQDWLAGTDDYLRKAPPARQASAEPLDS